jgi:transcriptional regulator
MYRRMFMIRLFEEQANDLYTRALMPGLAHLYIGEEAVAVGICETLNRDDYVTSTHRGHGHAIAKHIQRTSEDLLQVETGSLYPALHRLEAKSWIAASWELSDKGKRAKFYRLTPGGRKQLASEQSKWEAFARAMGLVLKPVDQEAQ